MGPGKFWKIIKDRKWVVIFTFLITVASTFAGTLMWPPQYEATATLVIDYDSANPMNLNVLPGGVISQSVEYINTQIEIIRSKKTAIGVIEYLKLDKIPSIIEEYNRAREGNPIFFWQREKDQDIKIWLVDEILSKYLEVERASDTRFLYIRFYSSDPDFSAAVANAYTRVYTDHNLELKVRPYREAVHWFSDKIRDVKGKADIASEQLRQYQKKKGIISVEGRYYDDAVQSLDEINKELTNAKARLYESNLALRRVKERGGSYEGLPEVLSNSFIQNLKAERIRLEASLSELSGKVGTKHPQYLRLQSELKTVNEKIETEIKNITSAITQEYKSAGERVSNLEKALSAQKSDILNLNISRYEMDSLNRESESFNEVYNSVLKKFNETVLQSDINRTNIFLIDDAVSPAEPSSPKFLLNMALAVPIGIFLGIGLSILFEYMDRTIKSGEVIENEFGISVLGTVPVISGE